MEPSLRARWWLVGLVVVTGLADLVTFVALKQFHIFEVNPIFVFTRSMWLMVGLKLAMLGMLSYTLVNGFAGRHANFMIVLGSLYVVVFQALGAYSNCQVAAANPPASSALEPAKAVATYTWVMVLNYLIPLIMGTAAYWVFDKCEYDPRVAQQNKEV